MVEKLGASASSSYKTRHLHNPFAERPIAWHVAFHRAQGLLGSTGLWPFVYDEANYFHPICMESAASELVKGLGIVSVSLPFVGFLS